MNRVVHNHGGGVQEEAPSLGVPVLVMRNNTERPEGIKAETAFIVGTNKEKIIKHVNKFLDDKDWYNKISKKTNPYGNGDASKKIIQFLKKKWIIIKFVSLV